MRPALVFSEENFEILLDAYEELKAKYDERGAAMRETGDMVRSLYAGSEVSRRIVKMLDEIENLKMICRRLSAAKSLDARDRIAKQCYPAFEGDPLRGENELV